MKIPSWVLAAALFLATFGVFRLCTTPAVVNTLDNQWYVPTAQSLLREGDTELSEFAEIRGFRRSYRIRRLETGTYNFFPIGTSLVSLPFLPVANLVYGDLAEPKKTARIADLIADLLAALSVVFFFLIAGHLGASRLSAFLASLLFAFCTPHLSIHGGGLWSHNSSLLLFLVSCWVLLRKDGEGSWWPVGFLAFLGYLCRPTSVLWIALLGLYVALHRRRQLLPYAGILTASFGGFVLWSVKTFGRVLPPYYQQRHFSAAQIPEALLGHLVSPGRGLFVFAPLLLISVVGVLMVLRRRRAYHPFYGTLILFCGVTWLFASTYQKWWGGGSFGPRLLAESFGAWALLLLPPLAAIPTLSRGRKLAALATALILAVPSAWIQYRGATDRAVYTWNEKPKRIDRAQERLWDWQDLQFLRSRNRKRR